LDLKVDPVNLLPLSHSSLPFLTLPHLFRS
jgi:hypothetical protein